MFSSLSLFFIHCTFIQQLWQWKVIIGKRCRWRGGGRDGVWSWEHVYLPLRGINSQWLCTHGIICRYLSKYLGVDGTSQGLNFNDNTAVLYLSLLLSANLCDLIADERIGMPAKVVPQTGKMLVWLRFELHNLHVIGGKHPVKEGLYIKIAKDAA